MFISYTNGFKLYRYSNCTMKRLGGETGAPEENQPDGNYLIYKNRALVFALGSLNSIQYITHTSTNCR